jgi:hypothetical protein
MAVFAAATCLVALSLTSDPAAETAFLLSALLAVLNGLSSLLLSHIGARRSSTKGFFGAVFGGMVLRMATTLAGFVMGVKVLLLPAVPFALALLILTGVFTIAEVALWSRQDFSPRVQPS